MKIGLFITYVLGLTMSFYAQERVRTIDEVHTVKNAPIAIVTRQLGDVTFNEKNQIVAGSDWLKELTLNIKNISNKNISYFGITLLIRKQVKMSTAIAFMMEFGYRIHVRNGVPVEVPKGNGLPPNKMIKIGISERNYELWMNKLKEFEAEDVERVILDIRQVRFEDGTVWHGGSGKWRQDSN